MTNLVIIGIHGLLNKPKATKLEEWWLEAISEGLKRTSNVDTTPTFKLAYWANVRNDDPIELEDLEERYEAAKGQGALRRYDPGLFDKARAIVQKYGGRLLDKEKDLIGLGERVEKLLDVKLGDLADYYDRPEIRRQIRDRLTVLLDQHKNDRVLVIAHSMGSIVAYDVLRELEAAQDTVDHLVTIGSPLGLPLVAKKIRREFGGTETPGTVAAWTNMADPGDKVALDCQLADEFDPNARGVKVTDVLVHNDYVNHQDKSNCHKSYGYLRTPELSDCLQRFLAGDD